MKFDTPPPYYPACDITMNFTNCEREQMHLTIYGVGAGTHLIVIFIACYILLRRRKTSTDGNSSLPGAGPNMVGGNRMIGQPMKSLCVCMVGFLATRLLHNTLCAFDVLPSAAIRTCTTVISCWLGYWGILLFTAGIIETVQQTTGRLPGQHAPRLHERLLVRIPSRRLTLSLLAAAGVIGTLAPAILGFMGGLRADHGDWDGHFMYVKAAWGFWGSIFVVLGAFYTYYAIVLTMTLRQLMPREQPFSSKNVPPSNNGHRRMYSIQTAYHPTDAQMETDVNFTLKQKKSNGDLYETTISLANVTDDSVKQEGTDYRKKSQAKFNALYAYAMKNLPGNELKSSQSTTALSATKDISEEARERNASITRLRGVLYHLIFFYFNCAFMSYVWAFGCEWLNAHYGIGTVIEVCFLLALWPSLTIVFFWRFWQMERARERSDERRSASGGTSINAMSSQQRTRDNQHQHQHNQTVSNATLLNEP
ncbi:hypothetical protein BDF22DRAFT_745371 [Syncephalis plumigaleata]|nr:hypothetical protein BDF22DRAFT_745371 [Syncephalis plumigaleata]